MSTDELLSALRTIENDSDLSSVAKRLAEQVTAQAPLLRATGKRIPASRHLEILCFRDARDPSLGERAEGWRATLSRLRQQQNDLLLIGVDVVPLQFVVLVDADNGIVVGLYSHPKLQPEAIEPHTDRPS